MRRKKLSHSVHIVVVFKQIFRRIFKSSKVQTRNNLVSIISDKKQQHSQLQMVRYKQNKACLQILLAALGWSWFGKAYGRKIRWRKTCLPYWFLCPETNIRNYIAKGWKRSFQSLQNASIFSSWTLASAF